MRRPTQNSNTRSFAGHKSPSLASPSSIATTPIPVRSGAVMMLLGSVASLALAPSPLALSGLRAPPVSLAHATRPLPVNMAVIDDVCVDAICDVSDLYDDPLEDPKLKSSKSYAEESRKYRRSKLSTLHAPTLLSMPTHLRCSPTSNPLLQPCTCTTSG